MLLNVCTARLTCTKCQNGFLLKCPIFIYIWPFHTAARSCLFTLETCVAFTLFVNDLFDESINSNSIFPAICGQRNKLFTGKKLNIGCATKFCFQAAWGFESGAALRPIHTARQRQRWVCTHLYFFLCSTLACVMLTATLRMAKIETCSILSQGMLPLGWRWRAVWMGLYGVESCWRCRSTYTPLNIASHRPPYQPQTPCCTAG